MKSISLIFFAILLISVSSCEREFHLGCLKPSGDVVTRDFDFDTFMGISIGVSAEVTIEESDQQWVTITAAQNVLDRIESDSEIRGGTLELEVNGCTRLKNEDVTIVIGTISPRNISVSGSAVLVNEGIMHIIGNLDTKVSGDGSMVLVIDQADHLESVVSGSGSLEISGAAQDYFINVSGDGSVKADEVLAKRVNINSSGSGSVYANVTEELDISTSGDSFIEVIGTAINQDIDMSGAGKIRNKEMISDNTYIDISGASSAELNVTEVLDVRITGSGNVCYLGNPSVSLSITGDGKLTSCN